MEDFSKKGVCKLFMEIHLTATECHLPYGITQCYLPPDTSENTPPLPQPDRLKGLKGFIHHKTDKTKRKTTIKITGKKKNKTYEQGASKT